MSALTLVGEQTSDDTYEVTATPDHGNRIRLHVGAGGGTGYRVMTASGGTISAHRTFETAVNAANNRAKRYVAAYSTPRTRTPR
jgi:hypothetical protein